MKNPEREPTKIRINCANCGWTNFIDREKFSKAIQELKFISCDSCNNNIFSSILYPNSPKTDTDKK